MKLLIVTFLVLFISKALAGSLELSPLIGNHMVLQQKKAINIWGKAQKNHVVSINFNGKNEKSIADANGNWQIILPAMKHGGPYQMNITDMEEHILLSDIYIGEVFVCSGQSNMEFNLKDAMNGEEEVKNAKNQQIRFFTVDKRFSFSPQNTLEKGNWSVCSPESAKYFSAVAYFFAKNLNEKLKIPIGLIHSSWGGTVAETWISKEGLQGQPDFAEKLKKVRLADTVSYNNQHRKIHDLWVKNFNAQDTGFVDGKFLWASSEHTVNFNKTINLPTVWEFTGKPDLINEDGVVWFRKEIDLTAADLKSNASLDFGYIQNADEAFFNGVQVGANGDDWAKRRIYNIPQNILKPGKNIIISRIENYGGDGGFRGKDTEFSLKTSDRIIPLKGEWNYRIGYTLTKYDQPEKEFGPNTLPTTLYNGMINPLVNYTIRGVIWYQGESNWDRGYQYRDLFKRLIMDWRVKFNQGDFPFLYVQLANHHEKLKEPADSYWAEVREAQDMALSLKNTAMATAIDIGNATNIHPKNKQAVGRRLAFAAEKMIYKTEKTGWGAHYKSMKVKKDGIYIKFNNVGEGLKIERANKLKGFEIAGADKKFYWAKAEIIGKNKIRVYADIVEKPVAARYAWEDNPETANLYNSIDLPTFPFRTDNWDGLTVKNK